MRLETIRLHKPYPRARVLRDGDDLVASLGSRYCRVHDLFLFTPQNITAKLIAKGVFNLIRRSGIQPTVDDDDGEVGYLHYTWGWLEASYRLSHISHTADWIVSSAYGSRIPLRLWFHWHSGWQEPEHGTVRIRFSLGRS